MTNFSQFIATELGLVSATKLHDIISNIKNSILVDIGVCEGASSSVMGKTVVENNNQIFGIDPIQPRYNVAQAANYTYIKDDSVLIGRNWDKGQTGLVFFDSVHAKEQVLCELFYWWELMKVGGTGVFHDTSWSGYIHKPGHDCAGKLTGNSGKGYDTYGGINWETPDKAVDEFFNISLDCPDRNINNDWFILLYEDENIRVETNYALLGMTFITKKRHHDYKSNINNWSEVFKRRDILLSFFK